METISLFLSPIFSMLISRLDFTLQALITFNDTSFDTLSETIKFRFSLIFIPKSADSICSIHMRSTIKIRSLASSLSDVIEDTFRKDVSDLFIQGHPSMSCMHLRRMLSFWLIIFYRWSLTEIWYFLNDTIDVLQNTVFTKLITYSRVSLFGPCHERIEGFLFLNWRFLWLVVLLLSWLCARSIPN